jgi:D-threo-aldose 1-dehydrogenase
MREPLPAYGFGGAAIGNLYRAVANEQAIATVHAALDGGFGLIDTAPYYGHGLSEMRIGAALAAWPSRRAMISTKVGRVLDPAAAGDVGDFGFAEPLPLRPRFDYSRDGVRRSLHDSLARLDVRKLDVALVHDIGALTHRASAGAVLRQTLDEALPALRDARAEGLVDRIGIGVNEWEVCLEVLAHADIDVILLAGRYTLFEQPVLRSPLFDVCLARGVRVMAAGVFNSGLLASRPSHASTYDYKSASGEAVARAGVLWDICARHGVAPQAAALQFPAAHPAVATVLVGARSPEEIAEISAWRGMNIPAGLWRELKEVGFIADTAPVPDLQEKQQCA